MFKTEFLCILTAGHTVDGREIPQQILNDVAETYNVEVYNARINLEHERGGWKAGSVLALKVIANQLFAELKPNSLLLSLVSQGQLLHTSCELEPNFAKTGKWYLIGLALTDEPASLGTSELHLSKKTNTEQFSTCESLELIAPEKPNLFKKLLNKKDDDMSDKATLEMLSQMQEQNAKQTEALTNLALGMTSLTKNLTAKPEEEETETDESTDLKEVKEQLSTLASKFETQGEELTGFKEKLSKITDEQDRDQATGGKNEDEEEIL